MTRRGWTVAAGLAGLLGSGCTFAYQNQCNGCVYAYHPMSGLSGPVVVDPGAPNLEGVRLGVHCPPAGDLNNGDRERLCRRVSELFENQGATVETSTGPALAEGGFDDPSAPSQDTPAPDLVLRLQSRVLHRGNPTLSWALSIATFTLVPAEEEEAFALDVTVSGGDGFILVEDSLQGRMTKRVGVGVIAVNWLVDRVVRTREERLDRPNAEKELSRDLYGHLSQLVFNARMRAGVLATSPPVSR